MVRPLGMSKKALWGRGIDPPADFVHAKSVAVRRKTTGIFLRKIRKRKFFGGRVAAPPLQPSFLGC